MVKRFSISYKLELKFLVQVVIYHVIRTGDPKFEFSLIYLPLKVIKSTCWSHLLIESLGPHVQGELDLPFTNLKIPCAWTQHMEFTTLKLKVDCRHGLNLRPLAPIPC